MSSRPTRPISQEHPPAVVELDRNLTYDLVLGLAVQEALEVTAMSPVVDLKKTEVNFNYTESEIAALPLERTYRGLFQLIPAWRTTGAPSARPPEARARTTRIWSTA